MFKSRVSLVYRIFTELCAGKAGNCCQPGYVKWFWSYQNWWPDAVVLLIWSTSAAFFVSRARGVWCIAAYISEDLVVYLLRFMICACLIPLLDLSSTVGTSVWHCWLITSIQTTRLLKRYKYDDYISLDSWMRRIV